MALTLLSSSAPKHCFHLEESTNYQPASDGDGQHAAAAAQPSHPRAPAPVTALSSLRFQAAKPQLSMFSIRIRQSMKKCLKSLTMSCSTTAVSSVTGHQWWSSTYSTVCFTAAKAACLACQGFWPIGFAAWQTLRDKHGFLAQSKYQVPPTITEQ